MTTQETTQMNQHEPAVDVSRLAAFDTDGALRESADAVNQYASRRTFLAGTGAALGGVLIAAAVPGSALAKGTPKSDIAILNFALTLEYLESAFYKGALKNAQLKGQLSRFAKVVSAHEATHVTALKKTLGSKAAKRPAFDFKGTNNSAGTFGPTAVLLEDTGVKAYQGQAPLITSQAVFKAAISIHPVEARHAGWIRQILGMPPAPDAFNPALTKAQVLAAVGGTGFIKA